MMIDALVVDDSPVIRKIARQMLERMHFAVREADDGTTAATACAATMPDVILLDWNMPIMSGIDVLAELRAMPNGAKP
jgi:two-component system chemotaxis response regulator CheY